MTAVAAGGVRVAELRVLLVEDNPADVRLIRALLHEERGEFALTHVSRLVEAVEVLERQRFDAILLDLSLPDSFGLATFERLYAASRRIPIVILTGNTDAEVALEAVQRGAHDYLVKSEVDHRLLSRALRYTVERHRLNERVEQAERIRGLGQVASKIAHEFNNVLMGIQPFTDLIARVGAEDPRIVRAAETITDAVRRGRAVSTEILRYTQPITIRLERFDAAAWLADVREELERTAAPVRLTCSAGEGLALVGDRTHLTQALVHLLRNARDASAPGGEIAVAVTRSTPAHVTIEVHDHGCGMSAEVLQRAFEPLFTTRHTAIGLGLPAALQIAEAHGGRITAESTPGGGATFRMVLPA